MGKNNNKKGILFACTTAALWGFLALAIKFATQYIPPSSIIWVRFSIAFLILGMFLGFRQPAQLKILLRPPFLLIMAALCLSFNYLGYAMGIDIISPAGAQVIIQMGPMLLAVGGVFFFKEQLSNVQLLGFGVVSIGFFLFYRHQITALFVGQEETFLLGALWVVGAAITWAVYALFQKQLVRTYPPQQLNLFLYGLPTLLYIPVVEFNSLIALDGFGWLLMLFLGLNTLVAYGCLSEALKYTEANKVSVIITLNPVITFAVLALMQFYELQWLNVPKMDLSTAYSGLVILLGVAMVVGSPKKKSA
ncbi:MULTISPECIES: DMT family transporter [Persicobacter]|uniref:EamA domain-containing protein n=1 Tax=Persicobacter diffluens TaxID=981 RepID=A0AAN4VX29_9BACT|nr:DMT family transporter [Persicobacter sp. CCB-QB2]GJM60513.1 hypothetical protein PEDI_10650 [Persicobacter diffluens]